MKTPIITIFIICVLIIALALAFYDYKKHGARQETFSMSRTDSDAVKIAKEVGEQLLQKKNYNGAIEEYKNALRRAPTDAYLHNDLGVAYYRLGLQSAQPSMEETEFGFGTEVDARHISKSEALEKTQDAVQGTVSGIITVVVNDEAVDKEIEAYAKSLNQYVYSEKEIKDDGGKEYWITIITGKTKEAFLNAEKEYLEAIKSISVKDASGRRYSGYSTASRNLGTLYFRMGKKSEAIAQWRHALRLEPNDAELRELLNRYE